MRNREMGHGEYGAMSNRGMGHGEWSMEMEL